MGEIVNPYIAGAPVTEQRMFFGREDIFQWIENSIAGQYADHILVVHGQRRVGKTSVLKQLGNRLPKRYIPVFFDLQGRTHTTLDHFLWWLARETVRVLKQDRDIEVPPPQKDAFAADPEFFENQFLTSLRTLLGKDTLLLTFDEFDNLEESEVKEELARPLIDHLRRLMGQPNLNFIFSIGSSGRKLENMQATYTDFFKTALYKKISFLNEEQTHNLVTRPVAGIIEYERAAVERIYRITSGHPYFTQLTCHELFARCQRTEQRKIAKSDVEAVLDDVVERGTVNLKFVWDEATDIEKWSLAALAHLDKTDNRALADYLRKNRVRFSESDLTSGLLHLREKDVLTPQNRFVIHLLRIWLQKNRPIEQTREELTEANPIASRFIEIGLEFRDGGQHEKAIEFFRQALSVSADNLQAQVNIALTYAAQGQLEQAITEFEKALTIDDEDVASRSGLCDAHLALGDAALKRGRAKDAVLSYQRVLGINAEHLEARQRMAELSRQRAEKALTDGKDEEALSAFAEALKFTPEDQTLIARSEKVRAEKNAKVLAEQLARSEKEAAARNWEKAIEALNAALEIAPGDDSILKKIQNVQEKQLRERLDGLLAKVEAAEKAGRWDTAISTLNEYLQLKPEDVAIQKRIANLVEAKHAAWLKGVMSRVDQATATQNWDEALTALNEALRLEPDNMEMQAKAAKVREARRIAELNAMLKRADQAAGAGRWDEAINILNDGLASDPENETLKTKLAEARKAKREAHLQAALRLADSAAQAGKWEAAVASLNEVLANEPDNAEFQKKLNEVRALEHASQWNAAQTQTKSLRDVELFEQALQAWQAYLSLRPEDRERVGEEIKQVTQELELRDFYAKAETAIAARDFDGAIRPLKEIIIRDENYKDASRLLTKAIDARRTGTTQKLGKPRTKPAFTKPTRGQVASKISRKQIGIIGGVVLILALVAAGIFFGPKFWANLSTLTQQAPTATETQSATSTPSAELVSLDPILAYISEAQPDFEDDFSSDQWGDLAEGVSTKNLIQDGSLILNLQAGTNSEKLVLGGSNFQASQFALEFDFYFDGGTGGTFLGVGFPSLSTETNNDVTIYLEEQSWSIDNTIKYSGEINETLVGQWSHLQIIYSDSQVAAFMNGELLGNAEGISHLGNEIWIAAVTEGQGKLRLDNIKFWNLDTFSSAIAFTKPILAFTADTPPDFEEDFSTPKDYWNTTQVDESGDTVADRVSNGAFNFSDNSDRVPNEGFQIEAIQGQDFALEFDYTLNSFTYSHLIVMYRVEEGESDVIKFNPNDFGLQVRSGVYPVKIAPDQIYHFQILVLDDQIAIFINDKMIEYSDESTQANGAGIAFATTAGTGFDASLDNIKFWNLETFKSSLPTATDTASPATQTQISPKDSMVMAFVPAGEFSMGSDTESSNEKPAHTVYLDAFWIDQIEITNKMYSLCVSAGICQPPKAINSYSRTSYYGNPEFENYPVTYVDWEMADTYCTWAGRRLPSEAEWEKAARGTTGYKFPWGNEMKCDKANGMSCIGETTPAGQYTLGKSPFGALDLAGNVMEWVADWYSAAYYASSPRENPAGPSSGSTHVLRGGSWKSNENSIRSSYRQGLTPDATNFYLIGFRCALNATSEVSTTISTPPPTQKAATFGESILAAIKNRKPDFQDEFSGSVGGWVFESKTDDGLSNMSMQNDALSMIVGPFNMGWSRNSILRFQKFALQVEANFPNRGGSIMILFGYNLYSKDEWTFHLNKFGQWKLVFTDNTGNNIITSSLKTMDIPQEKAMITILSNGKECAVYLNDVLLTYSADDRLGSGSEIRLGVDNENGVSMTAIQYNTIKIWNLDSIQDMP